MRKNLAFNVWLAVAGTLALPAAAQRPALVPQNGHGGAVTSLAVRQDGNVLASGDSNGMVKLWRVDTGEVVRTLRCPDKPLVHDMELALSPDGRWIAAAPAGQGHVTIWDEATGGAPRTLDTNAQVTGRVAFAPDGKIVAVRCYDKIVGWSVATGGRAFEFDTDGDFAFGRDSRTLVVASAGAIVFSDSVAKRALRKLPLSVARVVSLALSPDERRLAVVVQPKGAAVGDYHVWLLDARTGRRLYALTGTYPVVKQAQFSGEGRTVWAKDDAAHLGCWDVATGRKLASYAIRTEVLALTADGKRAAVGWGTEVALYRFAAGAASRRWAVRWTPESMALRADGRYAASAAGGTFVLLFDSASGHVEGMLALDDSGRRANVEQVAFSPDNRLLTAAGYVMPPPGGSGQARTIVRTWRCEDWKPLSSAVVWTGVATRRVGGSSAPQVRALRFAPDSRTVLCTWRAAFTGVDAPEPTTLAALDPATGKALFTYTAPTRFGDTFAHSADGRIVAVSHGLPASGAVPQAASAPDPTAMLEQTRHTVTISRLDAQGKATASQDIVVSATPGALAFSSIGSRLAVGDFAKTQPASGSSLLASDLSLVVGAGQFVSLYGPDAQSGPYHWQGSLCGGLSNQYSVSALAVSLDGRYLACGGTAPDLAILDLKSDRVVRRLEGNGGTALDVGFSADGNTVACLGSDRTVRLWDVHTGALLCAMAVPAIGDWVFAKPTPDSGIVLVATGSGATATVTAYDARTGAALRTDRLNGCIYAAPSPDGRLVAASFGSVVKLLDAVTGAEKGAIRPPDPVGQVVFAPDGRTLACEGQQRGVTVWDVATQSLRGMVPTPALPAKAFTGLPGWTMWGGALSPDGRTLAMVFGGDRAVLVDVSTGKARATIRSPGHFLLCAAFSADGARLFTGGIQDAGIPVDALESWDVKTGTLVGSNPGHGGIIRAVAVSPDGAVIATSADDRKIILWDAATQRSLAALDGRVGAATSLAFSMDGRFLLAGTDEGATQIWRLNGATGALACTCYSFSNDEFAVTDPEGRYDASHGGEVRGLHWAVGDEMFDLSQLKNRYYDPGLLAKRLGFSQEPLRSVAELRDVKLYPSVVLHAPASGSTRLRIDLKNRGGGIGRLRVLVNGKEITPDARGPAVRSDPNARLASVVVELAGAPTLVPGKPNNIVVVAYNAENYLSGRGVQTVCTPPGRPAPPAPELYAIVAGVSKFANPDLNLNLPSHDARQFAGALRLGAERLFGAGRVHIMLLASDGPDGGALPPTKANIRRAFASARRARPGDVFVVFLAGHGVAIQDTYCYLTREATTFDLAAHDVRQQMSVTSDEMVEWIKRVPATKQVMILDTCAAGAAARRLADRREVPGDQVRAIDRLKDRTGFFVLMGCAADAVSYEASRYGEGLLTFALLEAMKGAKLRDGEFVDVNLLFGYAVDTVPRLATAIGGVQRPEIMTPRRGEPFDVGELTPEDRQRIALPQPRPLILKPVLLDPDPEVVGDPLGLTGLLTRKLRDMSEAVARGGTAVFVDADEMAGALQPKGTYRLDGDRVRGTLALWRDGRRVAAVSFEGRKDDLSGLAANIAADVSRAATTP